MGNHMQRMICNGLGEAHGDAQKTHRWGAISHSAISLLKSILGSKNQRQHQHHHVRRPSMTELLEHPWLNGDNNNNNNSSSNGSRNGSSNSSNSSSISRSNDSSNSRSNSN